MCTDVFRDARVDGRRDTLTVMTAEPPAGGLAVTRQRRDGTIVLALVGELDLVTSALAREVLDQIETEEARRLVIDLSGLSFIDSTGIHLIVDEHQRLGRRDLPKLEIRPGRHEIQRVFQMIGLDEVLPFVDGR